MNRFEELMEYFGIDQKDIIKKTGIPKSSMSMYVSGKRNPRQDKLSLIADAYGVSETWLMGYDVPMLKSDEKNQLVDAGEALRDLLDIDFSGVSEFIQILRQLTDEQRKEYLEIGREMLKRDD
jgi:transcriptional regulator with XRE-family HTH domain